MIGGACRKRQRGSNVKSAQVRIVGYDLAFGGTCGEHVEDIGDADS